MKIIYLRFMPLLALFISAFHMQAQQIVAQYDFNGNAKDVSVNENHATIHGATLTQDRFGIANQAFVFSGSKSYLVAENSSFLQTATTSFSFWIRADESPAQG